MMRTATLTCWITHQGPSIGISLAEVGAMFDDVLEKATINA
jgi:hypothetical protein